MVGLLTTEGLRGAGHWTSMAWDSKAVGAQGGVSVEVRDGREVRLVEKAVEREDMPERESEEREEASERYASAEPTRDAGQWPKSELGGRELGGRSSFSAPGGSGHCCSERSERSRGGTAIRVDDGRGLISSPQRLSPARLSPPRLLCGRTGSRCVGSLISRSSNPPSSSEDGSSDESDGLFTGCNAMLRRRLFAPSDAPVVQILRLRVSVCA